jgi:hypothetical protein
LTRTINIFLIIVAICFLNACAPQGDNIDLRESFVYNDTRPFGASVAYGLMQNAYTSNKLEINKQTFSENYGWSYDKGSLYFNISRNYYASDKDVESLLEFVYKGNTAFISSSHFDSILLDKIFCKQADVDNVFFAEAYQNTAVNFVPELGTNSDPYTYFYYPFNNYFTGIHENYGRKIAVNDNGKTNLFVFFWGKGRLYLHCEPRAFSNYFLLSKNNYLYMKQVMQMLPANPENIYWDDFYAKKNYGGSNDKPKSTFSEIFKHPPLKAAFWIGLALLTLYILFGMKRRQRVVPVEKPVENTSVAFAEAIAGLYLSKKDNKVIADKMITYFNEQVRTRYFLHININDSSYADLLSRKSGVAYEQTKALANTILSLNASYKVSDTELLTLNGQIEKFFKHKK